MRRGARISISTALIGGFVTLTVVAIGVVMALMLGAGFQTTRNLLAEKSVLIVDTVAQNVTEFLSPLAEQVRYLSRISEAGLVELAWPDEVARVLAASLAAIPQASAIAFIDLDYRATIVVRGTAQSANSAGVVAGGAIDGAPVVMERDWSDYGPARTALLGLDASTSPEWGQPRYVEEAKALMLMVRMPVRLDGKLHGVFVATVELSALSKHLRELIDPDVATPFVLAGTEQVIAHSMLATPTGTILKTLPSRDELRDPVMAQLWQASSRDGLPPEIRVKRPDFDARFLHVGERDFVAVHRSLKGFSATGWTVGCYFPFGQFRDQFVQLRNGALAGLAVMLIACLFAAVVARGIRRPINRLARASQALRSDGVDAVRTLPPTVLRELDLAGQTFNDMVVSLREKARIRETFGRYVPSELAEDILSDSGALRPQVRAATVLFTDVVGFSTLSEHLDPISLITLLNEYFATVAEPIARHRGVIHQFQGDAVLATFNLPIEDPEHAANAVRAAWEIQQVLSVRRFLVEGRELELRTRVGINTGLIVGGTVGSMSRVGYTVHGDDVNLAARIEQLNKQFGTSILVSGATRDAALEAAIFEPVGVVDVRGRDQPVSLHRPSRLRQNSDQLPQT
jgi:adenylate cyclase